MTELNFSGIAADREERKLHVFFHVHWPPAAVRPSQRKTPGLEKVTLANSHTGQSQRSVHTHWCWLSPAVVPFATPLVALEAQAPLLRIWLKCREASALAKTAANASQFPLLRRLKSVLFLIASHQRIITPLRKREDWEALKENYWAVQKKEQNKNTTIDLRVNKEIVTVVITGGSNLLFQFNAVFSVCQEKRHLHSSKFKHQPLSSRTNN